MQYYTQDIIFIEFGGSHYFRSRLNDVTELGIVGSDQLVYARSRISF